MQWITGTIMGMGGMQACGFTLEEVQNEGLSIASYEINILKKKSLALFALRNMNAGLQGSIKIKTCQICS